MAMSIKQRVASGALALALLGGTGASVAAQNTNQGQAGGASGLVAAVVQAQIDDSLNDLVDVTITDSLNNLRVLNNILSDNDVDVVVQDISVLNDAQIEILTIDLSNSNLTLDDVVGVAILSGGDLIAFV